MAKKTNYEKNGFEYFRTSATVGFDADGKRIRKEFLGKSKKESELKRDQYLENVKKGLGLDFDKIGFGDYFIEWLEVIHKPTITQNTYNRI
ncbi:hypothetical protein [Fusibacter ferrireducens]|uniref:AP2-like integrase N-terminal domain-containing protein n=1 Tax=Fusibacter ferrireducens TaxID=2785058 RepID=A0ABR9ZWI1_9FIRM|nr:hypothetical protein [Fusibacter ferrireducens]MBF4693979.1 hypothetical protein [Fusibacter ferrireducens]